jgi:hypothetical protein
MILIEFIPLVGSLNEDKTSLLYDEVNGRVVERCKWYKSINAYGQLKFKLSSKRQYLYNIAGSNVLHRDAFQGYLDFKFKESHSDIGDLLCVDKVWSEITVSGGVPVTKNVIIKNCGFEINYFRSNDILYNKNIGLFSRYRLNKVNKLRQSLQIERKENEDGVMCFRLFQKRNYFSRELVRYKYFKGDFFQPIEVNTFKILLNFNILSRYLSLLSFGIFVINSPFVIRKVNKNEISNFNDTYAVSNSLSYQSPLGYPNARFQKPALVSSILLKAELFYSEAMANKLLAEKLIETSKKDEENAEFKYINVVQLNQMNDRI